MDDCFNSLYQREDDDRKVGVSPAREFMAVTDDALETNSTMLVHWSCPAPSSSSP